MKTIVCFMAFSYLLGFWAICCMLDTKIQLNDLIAHKNKVSWAVGTKLAKPLQCQKTASKCRIG